MPKTVRKEIDLTYLGIIMRRRKVTLEFTLKYTKLASTKKIINLIQNLFLLVK